MPVPASSQTELIIGVDVGGTFTDLVASDGQSLRVVKVPSTPQAFERGVIEAIGRVAGSVRQIVHGSTVATNALLQRAGANIALITTDGFSDLLLIGRQNRTRLYALKVERVTPITQVCFGVPERIDAAGQVVKPLDESAVARVIHEIVAKGIRDVAVCLLFSFVNGEHERRVGEMCRRAGLTVSLSSELLPEFREYERGSTTAINASLRPVVESYLGRLVEGLSAGGSATDLRVMHGAGGTLAPAEAGAQAARLVLSGPAGGILGAAFVARAAGFADVITYDMGGTSTDVATIVGGAVQWTTTTVVDGLPIALPMFDIHTVGAGGGSVAYVDGGGALRVGPRSAGATPGPACYGRGGTEPTVTDANLLLGRILPDRFLGGAMEIRRHLAERAVGDLAARLGKSLIETSLGIVTVAEANMAGAIRAVTSRRGHDPRQFTLVSFGGAGGLHVCAIAMSLDIRRVLVPPYAGVLSALGMVVAPPVAEASKTVVQLGADLDDARLAAEYGRVSGRTMEVIPYERTAAVEAWADVRFKGQSHELQVRIGRPSWAEIEAKFIAAYEATYGRVPAGRAVEVVTVRVRRIGRGAEVTLPKLDLSRETVEIQETQLVTAESGDVSARVLTRAELLKSGAIAGPMLLIDAEATGYVPPNWRAEAREDGAVILTMGREG
jgi:N-methylhydantoinase A